MFIAQFYKKTATFHVLRVVTLRHFEFSNQKQMGGLKKPRGPIESNRASGFGFENPEEHVLLFFFGFKPIRVHEKGDQNMKN